MTYHSNNSLPLVLLPGTGCNNSLWTQLLSTLPKFIEPIMLDLLSCDSVDAMLDRIAEVAPPQFALLGFSMGGYLAQAFFARFPERLSQLILVCCTGEGYTPEYRERRLKMIAKLENDPPLITSEQYLAPFLDANQPNTQQIKLELVNMLNTVGINTVCRQMRMTIQRDNYYAQLQQCQIPSLVIGAKHDRIVPVSQIEKLAAVLHTQSHWLDCGHMVPLEMPEALGQILASWLKNSVI